MIFTYRCRCPHASEHEYPIGTAPQKTEYDCPRCEEPFHRDFIADVQTMELGVVDPYRSYANSSTKMHEEARQQREIRGPKDHFERRHLEKTQGIQFIGNDTSGFSAKARRGIDNFTAKKRSGDVQ